MLRRSVACYTHRLVIVPRTYFMDKELAVVIVVVTVIVIEKFDYDYECDCDYDCGK
jgi:hypothetical protein